MKIELAHNKAIWTLGPNKHEKVSSSLAWTLAKNEGTAKPVDQDTSAAGRPAERSAADTSVTASEDDSPEDKPRGLVAPGAAAPAAPPAAEAEPAAAPQPPPPPPAVQPPAKASRAAVIGGESGGGAPAKTTGAPSKKVEVPGEKYLKCLTGVKALHLVLRGQANGKTTYQVTGGVKLPADVKACVDKVTAGITLEPGAHADVDLTK